jgi:GNAT superfamily N-acetyltransferase
VDLRFVEQNQPDIIKAIGALRAEVWRDEPEIFFHEFGDSDCWTDPVDDFAYHWVVYDGDELVAAARLSLHADLATAPYASVFEQCHIDVVGKVASINRLVVKKSHRGAGIARALDRIRLKKAIQLGAKAVIAVPVGDSRAKALASLGYLLLEARLDPHALSLPLDNTQVSVMVMPVEAGALQLRTPPVNLFAPSQVGTR